MKLGAVDFPSSVSNKQLINQLIVRSATLKSDTRDNDTLLTHAKPSPKERSYVLTEGMPLVYTSDYFSPYQFLIESGIIYVRCHWHLISQKVTFDTRLETVTVSYLIQHCALPVSAHWESIYWLRMSLRWYGQRYRNKNILNTTKIYFAIMQTNGRRALDATTWLVPTCT